MSKRKREEDVVPPAKRDATDSVMDRKRKAAMDLLGGSDDDDDEEDFFTIEASKPNSATFAMPAPVARKGSRLPIGIYLMPGETVMMAMERLKSVQNRRDFTRLNKLAKDMMSKGHYGVYQYTLEQLNSGNILHIETEEDVEAECTSFFARLGTSEGQRFTGEKMGNDSGGDGEDDDEVGEETWEYLLEDSDDVHGIFTTEEMLGWKEFFKGQKVLVRHPQRSSDDATPQSSGAGRDSATWIAYEVAFMDHF